ncbi:MAG TPA: DsbA family oxidoreductase [Candidatus Obscuribacterales bacterium]
MHIDIWADIVCPFCYIGKRHLETALAGFPGREGVEIRWHSFELDPRAPERDDRSVAEILSAKYGQSPALTEEMLDRVIVLGAQSGLNLRLREAIRVNSFLAHRLIYLAASHNLQDQAVERLMRAYFTEIEDLSNPETLIRLFDEIGISEDVVRTTLDSGAFAGTVRDDERTAHELGISGVPFFLLDQKYALSGAQPVSVFRQALADVFAKSEALAS